MFICNHSIIPGQMCKECSKAFMKEWSPDLFQEDDKLMPPTDIDKLREQIKDLERRVRRLENEKT